MKTLAALALCATLACTANVQDLGTPLPPPPTNPQEAACHGRWPLHGTDCGDDGASTCNPTSTLQCVCGVDKKWVCLDGTLGLLTEHAIAPDLACDKGVTYQSSAQLCSCGDFRMSCHGPVPRNTPEDPRTP